MPRVALIGDSHFDASSRFEECIRVHDWIADDLAARGIDVVLHSGDLYERKSTPDERRAVATWVQKVTRFAPLVIVKGNHDAERDIEILARLETDHPVIVEEAAGVHCVGGCVIGCLAWPRKASVLSLARQHVMDHAEGELLAGEALRAVLRGLGQQMDGVRDARGMEGAPKILLAHAMVRGSRVSTGQPLVGCDLELGLEDLALARADFVALGHIHMPQEWQTGDVASWDLCDQEQGLEPGSFTPHEHGRRANVCYPGSPRRTAYGEIEEKGYVIAEFQDGALLSWQRVPTPCASMVLLESDWIDGSFDESMYHFDAGPGSAGAEVRFRYSVAADARDAARSAAQKIAGELLELGAADVKIEERVVTSNAARAPEVAEARTLPDKLRALWTARGTTPDAERAERLVGKASDLERRQHEI